ncbi:TRAP transporter 4TM/12TM fusion protein [Bacillus oleivorans]|uniref:TRAP transporter 4TM/12TM fusion protein n=1 Tax=Bacillus oleivorans TaxID=1448271 RepID=A0A285CPZ7_9BACI|nr:TRAP transporter permease [Bacillus oleivorans]SNX69617.1 TRAP transporter 4TM/12TM fusion protein [Bacillus oleivorans]
MFKFKKTPKAGQEMDLDKEGGGGIRQLTGKQATIAAVFAIGLSVFSIYVNGFMNIQEIYRNVIFLGFLFVLGFLLYPATKKGNREKFSILDTILAVVGLSGVLYILFSYSVIHNVRMSQAITQDYIFAIITVVILLEVARRTIGIFIPLLSFIALIYAVYGPSFPGLFAHAGFSIERLLYRIYMTTEGVFGMTFSIATTYIIIFILFGAFLTASGATKLFNDLAIAIAGQRRGGPAQVAVISSALTGTLSGSAVANVATTGTFTIPLMKGLGLKPRFAGAVEAAASTGGMIMPPIMGAAAFIMAGFLGVSYNVIILAAVIPAILYYAALIFAIDIEAKKQGLKGMSKDSIPQVWAVLKERGLLLLPIIVIIGTLLSGRTPLFAGFAGIITVIVTSWLTKDKSNRITFKKVVEALIDGAKGTVQVGVACASVGIIIAVVTMTGLGSTLAYNIIELSGGELSIILVLIMITCIILSMGLPSTALYIVVAVTAAPALVEAGVNPIAAHFFVFWFGALSNVTPPVALASYTAAGLAGADAMKTSWTAVKLCLPGFIIPFMIAYNPIMVMQNETGGTASIVSAIPVLLTGMLGVFALAVAVFNFFRTKLNIFERIGFFATAILLIDPGMVTDIIGLGIVILLLAIHITRSKKLDIKPGSEVGA